MYYSLPDDQVKAFNLVMETLQHVAIKLWSANDKMPTLFIDGVSLIAKHKMELFVHMLIAKDVADEGTLTIVLVSSKGLPMIIEQQNF